MYRLLFIALIAAVSTSCGKDADGDEAVLYGTWVKGSNAGDTLLFFRRANGNFLAYNLSFNPALAAPTEVEYAYRNNVLYLGTYLAQNGGLFQVHSFTWGRFGTEFEVQGSELYPFMSSTLVRFTYRKVD